jgi:hypothetical protein
MTTKQKEQEASDAAVAEFLANGGVIRQITYNASGNSEGKQSYYGRPGRPKAGTVPPPTDTDAE